MHPTISTLLSTMDTLSPPSRPDFIPFMVNNVHMLCGDSQNIKHPLQYCDCIEVRHSAKSKDDIFTVMFKLRFILVMYCANIMILCHEENVMLSHTMQNVMILMIREPYDVLYCKYVNASYHKVNTMICVDAEMLRKLYKYIRH